MVQYEVVSVRHGHQLQVIHIILLQVRHNVIFSVIMVINGMEFLVRQQHKFPQVTRALSMEPQTMEVQQLFLQIIL